MKILIAADLHIGKNGFNTTNEKWAQPMAEFVDYAIENSYDAVAFAGDVFHHRRPTTWASQFVQLQISRLIEAGIQVLGADGNHDDGVAPDSVSATWILKMLWARKTPDSRYFLNGGSPINIVLLPWPTPAAYDAPTDMSLNESLEWTQSAALDSIKQLIVPDAVNILIGHAMVAYGPGADDLAPSPGLQWAGKDVVFDYGTLSKGFDAVYLGHVHDPRMKGYVGSSQPTDWGDAGQTKSFVELVIAKCEGIASEVANHGHFGNSTCTNGVVCTETIIPYKTSLKLLDVKPDLRGPDPLDEITEHYDVGRWRYHVEVEEYEPTPEALAEVRTRMNELCDRVESIEVTRERVVVQRVATDTPLAAMRPEDAADAWLRHTGLDSKIATDVKAKFATLVQAGE